LNGQNNNKVSVVENQQNIRMMCMLALIAVDRASVLWASQTKDYKIRIFCFSVKHPMLMIKGKD
jgi:hypothetical protein